MTRIILVPGNDHDFRTFELSDHEVVWNKKYETYEEYYPEYYDEDDPETFLVTLPVATCTYCMNPSKINSVNSLTKENKHEPESKSSSDR